MACDGPLLGCCDDTPIDPAGYQKVRLTLLGPIIERPGGIDVVNDAVRGAVLAALNALPWPGGPVGESRWQATPSPSGTGINPVLVSTFTGPDPDSFPYERRTSLVNITQSPSGAFTSIGGYAIKVRLTRPVPSYGCIREFDSANAFEEFAGALVGCTLAGTGMVQLTSQPPTTGEWMRDIDPFNFTWYLRRSFDNYLGVLANMDPCCNPAP